MHEEHNIFKMGGLRKELPLAFGVFLIAGCSLAGLPLITAGFYSKGLIVWEAWSSPQGSAILWLASVVGVLLTALYIFRVIFLVFFGEAKASVTKRPGYKIQIPLVVLAVLSLVGGFVNLPPELGNEPLFTRLLDTALPPVEQGHFGPLTEIRSEGVRGVGIPHRAGSGVSVIPSQPPVVGRSDRNSCGKSPARVLVCRLGIRLVLRQAVRAAGPVVCAVR